MHGSALPRRIGQECASSKPIKTWPDSFCSPQHEFCDRPTGEIRKLRQFFVSCLLIILGSFLCVLKAHPEEIKVVVNPSVQQEELSKNALRAIFGMRLRTWPNDEPIRVFIIDRHSPIHTKFAKKKLDIFPHQLQRAWDRLVFSGIGQAPSKVSSAEEMRAMIATTPGAIGYLPKEMVNENVRVAEVK